MLMPVRFASGGDEAGEQAEFDRIKGNSKYNWDSCRRAIAGAGPPV